MSFVQRPRVQFHRVLATPPSDRQRYGAPYPSVAQLKGRGRRRASTDLFWGERPLSEAWKRVVEAGSPNQVVHDVTANVRTSSTLSTSSSSPLSATNDNAEASNAPSITLPAAVQQQLAKSITSLLIPPNTKLQLRHSFPVSCSYDGGSGPISFPLDGPPSLSASSSSNFTASPYATTPDEDSLTPYFGSYTLECNIPGQVENVDASVFEHLGNQ